MLLSMKVWMLLLWMMLWDNCCLNSYSSRMLSIASLSSSIPLYLLSTNDNIVLIDASCLPVLSVDTHLSYFLALLDIHESYTFILLRSIVVVFNSLLSITSSSSMILLDMLLSLSTTILLIASSNSIFLL